MGSFLTGGLAGGFGEREQNGVEEELPVVGRQEHREGSFVSFRGSPKSAGCYPRFGVFLLTF